MEAEGPGQLHTAEVPVKIPASPVKWAQQARRPWRMDQGLRHSHAWNQTGLEDSGLRREQQRPPSRATGPDPLPRTHPVLLSILTAVDPSVSYVLGAEGGPLWPCISLHLAGRLTQESLPSLCIPVPCMTLCPLLAFLYPPFFPTKEPQLLQGSGLP